MEALAQGLRSVNTAIYGLPIYSTPVPASSTVLLHPLSRGTVNLDLTAASPEDAEPRVDYRTLSNPVDEAVLVEFVRFARRYFRETSLARYGPVEVGPGADVTSDAGLVAFVRTVLAPTQHHPVGTAAMLPRRLGGVVDDRLRVYGVAGLRVVDASIMPTLPGANTCQTVYAVAEKVRTSPPFPWETLRGSRGCWIGLIDFVTGCGLDPVRLVTDGGEFPWSECFLCRCCYGPEEPAVVPRKQMEHWLSKKTGVINDKSKFVR